MKIIFNENNRYLIFNDVMSSEIIRTALTRLRVVINDIYHLDQQSQGYHLHFQVVLFQSGSRLAYILYIILLSLNI